MKRNVLQTLQPTAPSTIGQFLNFTIDRLTEFFIIANHQIISPLLTHLNYGSSKYLVSNFPCYVTCTWHCVQNLSKFIIETVQWIVAKCVRVMTEIKCLMATDDKLFVNLSTNFVKFYKSQAKSPISELGEITVCALGIGYIRKSLWKMMWLWSGTLCLTGTHITHAATKHTFELMTRALWEIEQFALFMDTHFSVSFAYFPLELLLTCFILSPAKLYYFFLYISLD